MKTTTATTFMLSGLAGLFTGVAATPLHHRQQNNWPTDLHESYHFYNNHTAPAQCGHHTLVYGPGLGTDNGALGDDCKDLSTWFLSVPGAFKLDPLADHETIRLAAWGSCSFFGRKTYPKDDEGAAEGGGAVPARGGRCPRHRAARSRFRQERLRLLEGRGPHGLPQCRQDADPD